MIFSNQTDIRNAKPVIFINNNNEAENDPNLILPLSQITPQDQSPYIRFLGVYIDPFLSYKHHINLITGKLSKALYIMRTAKKI